MQLTKYVNVRKMLSVATWTLLWCLFFALYFAIVFATITLSAGDITQIPQTSFIQEWGVQFLYVILFMLPIIMLGTKRVADWICPDCPIKFYLGNEDVDEQLKKEEFVTHETALPSESSYSPRIYSSIALMFFIPCAIIVGTWSHRSNVNEIDNQMVATQRALEKVVDQESYNTAFQNVVNCRDKNACGYGTFASERGAIFIKITKEKGLEKYAIANGWPIK